MPAAARGSAAVVEFVPLEQSVTLARSWVHLGSLTTDGGNMTDEDRLSELIGGIYETAADIRLLPRVLKALADELVGIDRSDNAEVRSISHRLVLPAVAIPEMVRPFQNMAKAGRQASEGAEAAGAKDAASADTKTKN
jgi:hypothetical protein